MECILRTASKFKRKIAQKRIGELSDLLAYLRAASHIHQTHHWQTSGGQYYSDHLLFMRLYDESQDFIDGVAERAVGAGSEDLVDAVNQVDLVGEIVHKAYDNVPGSSAEDMAKRSLAIEGLVLKIIKNTIDQLSDSDNLSPGISNLLEDLADKHETFVYLLRQRLK